MVREGHRKKQTSVQLSLHTQHSHACTHLIAALCLSACLYINFVCLFKGTLRNFTLFLKFSLFVYCLRAH